MPWSSDVWSGHTVVHRHHLHGTIKGTCWRRVSIESRYDVKGGRLRHAVSHFSKLIMCIVLHEILMRLKDAHVWGITLRECWPWRLNGDVCLLLGVVVVRMIWIWISRVVVMRRRGVRDWADGASLRRRGRGGFTRYQSCHTTEKV